ncbi:non-ribosomal peptide synthetase [Rhodococcus sp. IEGM 1330]|uniref:non-ribosomal peptide synthetase n=1 Tax=Rhodococcus sp. IEGM 1330 TaxID=3082225 RepID=UPI002955440A|nr:non-ribosomal peptide synthetase [Rhodococcus sp. IEGM 1330]MDV8023891.1 non-ribosomal peptide synthetase [Rhodococcus sp. IEGM 1330]
MTASVDDLAFTGLSERFGERPVQVCVDGELGVTALEQRSAQVRDALTRAGVGRGHVVAVKGRRDSWLLPTLLGILGAGAAYTVIPYNSPQAVEAQLLETVEPAAMVVWEDLHPASWRGCTSVALGDAVVFLFGSFEPASPAPRSIDDPAYIITTSGTSGTPKAVLVPHRAVLAFLDAACGVVALSRSDVVAARSSAAFDLSVWELFASVGAGTTAVLVVEGVAADTARLHELLAQTGASVLSTTPSAAYQLGAYDEAIGGGLALRQLLVGGEASDGGRLADVMAAPSFGRCRLVNWYGPTEVTVSCTGGELVEQDLAEPRTPIGPALSGVRTEVLPVADGVGSVEGLGQLAVGGDQLAHGYLGNPRATAAAFVPDPAGHGDRLYLTGDIVGTDAGDRFVYHGRADDQIQLRGYRLELGEVERAIASHPGIRWSHATVGGTDLDVLVAYFATFEDVDRAELWSQLYRTLPRHAVPAALVNVAEVPVTVGQKLDVAKLPAPVITDFVAGTTAGRAAETDTEERLLTLWRRLLGIEEIGTDHHFFALGGHSLLVARLVNGIAREFGVRLQLADVVEGLTVREIASVVDRETNRLAVGASASSRGQEEMSW